MLIHFLFSFGFVYHHCVSFFFLVRTAYFHFCFYSLYLHTLFSYVSLTNKKIGTKGKGGAKDWWGFFFFFLVYNNGNQAGWAGYHYHYYGNLPGAWWEIRSWGIFVWIFFLESQLAILLVSLKTKIGRRCEFYPKIAEGEREKREEKGRNRTEQNGTDHHYNNNKKKKKLWNAIFRFTLWYACLWWCSILS